MRKDLDSSRIAKDEEPVQSSISTTGAMSNPFSIQEDGIVNIATGAVAPLDVENSLDKAEELRKKAADEFTEKRPGGRKGHLLTYKGASTAASTEDLL